MYKGVGLTLLAVLIWSGNFIVARGVFRQIPPVSLAFYRWCLATILIFPFVLPSVRADWPVIRRSGLYLLGAAITGIAFFNTFVYIGAHYTTAINLSLIGTTSSPIFAVVLARIFLRERIGPWKLAGMTLCVSGVLYLLSAGNLRNLVQFRFTQGDVWVLMAGLSFAIYTTLTKRKPPGISSLSFLAITFAIGTLLLAPFFVWEISDSSPVKWTGNLFLVILFLGLGASIVSFMAWNKAVPILGAGRTALFGNLIPVFTSILATLFLQEDFNNTHIVSMVLVFTGILLATKN
jgi:drug/metabolite transporter (DMT)-like permease